MTPQELRQARRDAALMTDAQLNQLRDRGPNQLPPEAWAIIEDEFHRRQRADGTSSEESPLLEGNIRDYDKAYASFLYSGLAALGIVVIVNLSLSEGSLQTLGFLVVSPLVIIWLGTTGNALIRTFRLPPHLPLWMLVLDTLFCVVAMVAFGTAPVFAQLAVAVFYLALAIGVPGWWFLYSRKRYLDNQGGTSSGAV